MCRREGQKKGPPGCAAGTALRKRHRAPSHRPGQRGASGHPCRDPIGVRDRGVATHALLARDRAGLQGYGEGIRKRRQTRFGMPGTTGGVGASRAYLRLPRPTGGVMPTIHQHNTDQAQGLGALKSRPNWGSGQECRDRWPNSGVRGTHAATQ